MRFLSRKSDASPPAQIPAGSFTVDSAGEILVATIAKDWMAEYGPAIARAVVDAFVLAEDNELPLAELVVEYAGLKITARNLRGGAIVFVDPLAR